MREPTPLLEAFGRRVREARKDAGLTLRQLGERTDLSNAGLCQIENAQCAAGIDTLFRLCCALNKSADFLMFGNEEYAMLEDSSP